MAAAKDTLRMMPRAISLLASNLFHLFPRNGLLPVVSSTQVTLGMLSDGNLNKGSGHFRLQFEACGTPR